MCPVAHLGSRTSTFYKTVNVLESIKSPESPTWPIAMVWSPSSVDIFSITTGQILTKFGI